MRPFTFPQRATEAAASALAASGSDRRDFLTRVAAFGAAFAARPLSSMLRPDPALANHCGDPGCETGYSTFCCTLTGGKNECPGGTAVGGWWYAFVSGSTCPGGVRCYIDCVGDCDSCDDCMCAHDPPWRRMCCNQGYTNCGRGGHLRCRIVRCENPGLLWPECTITATTDEATCSHTAACLGDAKCA